MKKKKITSLFISLILVMAMMVSVIGCQANPNKPAGITSNAQGETADAAIKKGTPWLNSNVVGAVIDDTVTALNDDFYLAVNYDYLKNTTIREGEVGEDSFTEVADIAKESLHQIMTDASFEGHDAQLIRELYAMWLDWDERNRIGMSLVMPYLETIEQLENLDDLSEYLVSEEGLNYGAGFVSFYFDADLEDSQWYCFYVGSTPLALADSDEYSKPTPTGERDLEADRKITGLLLEKAGYDGDEIERLQENKYAFEKEIAPSILSFAEKNAPDIMSRVLNRVTMEELAELSPNFPLVEIIQAMGVDASERIILDEPEWLAKLNELYTEENFEKLKSYILIATLSYYGERLDEDTFRKINEIDNEAWGISGSKRDEELAVDSVRDTLMTSVSKVYAEQYLSPQVREDVAKIVEECVDAYRVMLVAEDWLSPETRDKAIEKLDNMTINVSYPDKWADTENLKFTSRENGGNYFTAMKEIDAYRDEMEKKKMNTKVVQESWADYMSLTEVNAFYNPLDNSINILGGILQGDFYRPDMTEEEKLAGIGSVIAHEISHGFDTSGAQFDKDGNLFNWWTEEDYTAFEARAEKLVAYYDTIVPFGGGDNYSGNNVQGEAIADMAGLKSLMLIAEEKEDFDYDRFFRAYVSLWKMVSTKEFAEFLMYQDTHPLRYLRGNVTLMQLPEFYETYGIQEGDGMYMAEEDRIAVW